MPTERMLTEQQAEALAESVSKIVRAEAQGMLQKFLTQRAAEAVAEQTIKFVDQRIAIAIRVGIDAAFAKRELELSNALQDTRSSTATWEQRIIVLENELDRLWNEPSKSLGRDRDAG